MIILRFVTIFVLKVMMEVHDEQVASEHYLAETLRESRNLLWDSSTMCNLRSIWVSSLSLRCFWMSWISTKCLLLIHKAVNPLTAELLWWWFIHFHLTWVCWQPVLQDFTCCHQTYNNSRPHDRLHPVNCLSPRKTTPTRRHCLLYLAESPNLMGFTRFASTACSHKVHSWDAAVRGRWLPPKLTNWCRIRPRRSHTSTMMSARGCALSNPAARDTPLVHPPCVRFSARGTLKNWIFPQSLLYVSRDFHTFGPFPERIVLFQVSGTVYDA